MRKYDIYSNIHSNADVREACRQLQLREYFRQHGEEELP